ncbi:MAG: TrmH family RNA methyltransferase [Synechococcaceae cyanobacterium]|nr:TrmH family RNA methyltransferase [Synechococcaceae cyanobacterium]
MDLQLVLVEPAGPLNVGSVARLCANFGVAGLRLVAPRCDPHDPDALRMAMAGRPLLRQALRYPHLAAALADRSRVVACSGRGEGEPLPPLPPPQALTWLLEGHGAAALVFGREDRGLSVDELLLADRILTIPTPPGFASLNLSHAVAIVLHSLHSLENAGEPGSAASGSQSSAGVQPTAAAAMLGRSAAGVADRDPCPRGELDSALADAENLLLEVGFLLPHTARARMRKLRSLLQRAQPSSAEVALLRGMVGQLRWASRHPHPGQTDQGH